MGFPVVYRSSGDNTIASYTYTDIIEGAGVVRFYGGRVAISGSTIYQLSKSTFNDSVTGTAAGQDMQAYTTVSTTSGTNTLKIDLDFDTNKITSPFNLEGTMLVNVPFSGLASAGGTNGTCYIIVYLKKLDADGTTETTIASDSSLVNNSNGTNPKDVYFSFPIAVPLTNFKPNEKIRITLEGYVWRSAGSGTWYWSIFHDPQNNAVTATATQPGQSAGFTSLEFFLPFKIDL